MEKTFNPSKIEQRWAAYWEDQHCYTPNDPQYKQLKQQTYSITLPPPNVTGTLHMGHGFQYTLMDALIRRKRMQGFTALWQPGTDHAGIATQMVVERELSKESLTRHDLGRESFISRVWDWKTQSGSKITGQIRRLGASLDWTRERFSMDDQLSHATTQAFIKLYNDGLIYRGKRLVNWDTKLNTAISDLEVINKESQGSMWYIKYPLTDGSGKLTVATTRPETMLGDTAVAVHPEDERYLHLVGQTVDFPLTNRKITIIADQEIDPDFGTGCVKITPAHDFNDFEVGKRNHLDSINIMTLDGHLNENVPETYQGLERFAARKRILQDLEQADLIEKIEPHILQVPTGDRSGTVIEPMLTDQWFVKMQDLAKPAKAAVERGDMKLIPSNWNKTYFQWLDHIQDWCISRQLWWGHRIPAWFDEQGQVYVATSEQAVRQQHQLSDNIKLTQDNDVLDTWFTASLCPFSSLGWPEKTEDINRFYPNSVLVTGFDIIFFWVARMVMMGLYFLDDVPFKEVYIHGLIRDSQGQKMSKSKGNVLDPIDLVDGIELEALVTKRTSTLLQPHMANKVAKQTRKEFPNGIESFGTDALRFTYCALASTGRDINFDMGRIEGYRNFCNKLWNATRFILLQVDGHDLDLTQTTGHSTDQWIQSQLRHTIEQVEEAYSQYRFDLIAQHLYEFTWNEFCDWYLELAKCRLNHTETSNEEKNSTRITLLTVLETLLRLMHPIIPFITEEIWQTVGPLLKKDENTKTDQPYTIMLQPYPTADTLTPNSLAKNDIEWLKKVVSALRNVRGEMGISPAKKMALMCQAPVKEDHERLQRHKHFIQTLAKVEHIDFVTDYSTLPACATAVVDNMELHIPLAGVINKEQEITRLNKEMQKLRLEMEKCEKKLNNPNYVNKAPKDVVEKEKQRLNESQLTLEKLQTHYSRIESL